MKNITWSDLAFLLGPLAIGIGLTSFFTPTTFRQCGRRPALQPPGWAFGVAWVVLYALVGVAGMLAWRHAGRRWHNNVSIYVTAIGFMMLWWVVFSNWCAPLIAFTTLLSSLGSVAASMAVLYHAGAVASAWLTAPLVAWLAFASYLSYAAMPEDACRA